MTTRKATLAIEAGVAALAALIAVLVALVTAPDRPTPEDPYALQHAAMDVVSPYADEGHVWRWAAKACNGLRYGSGDPDMVAAWLVEYEGAHRADAVAVVDVAVDHGCLD